MSRPNTEAPERLGGMAEGITSLKSELWRRRDEAAAALSFKYGTLADVPGMLSGDEHAAVDCEVCEFEAGIFVYLGEPGEEEGIRITAASARALAVALNAAAAHVDAFDARLEST